MMTTTGEYALRAAVYLAQHHPDACTSAQIAGGTRVPAGYLSKLLQAMVRAELIHSQRGLHGGFTLQREPRAITVLDVLAAVNAAPERIRKCPLGLKGHVTLCRLHRLVDESVEHAERAYASETLADLCSSTTGSIPLCDSAAERC
jgi:Rrf2 family protein